MTTHPDFPAIQRRLKAIGLYGLPVDNEWGPGMAAGIDQVLTLVEKAKGIEPPKWPNLDPRYAWLRDVGPLPRHLEAMLGLLGTKEYPGGANNPVIMGWRDQINAKYPKKVVGYSADSVPWCGLGMAYAMLKADREIVDSPLWALNWSKWGQDGGQPELGDLLTFVREGGGHVALYIAEDRQGYFHILGANQSDSVNIIRIAKSRMKACRQPPYHTKPASVKPYIVESTGQVSRNEA